MKKICYITTVSTTLNCFVLETAKHLHKLGDYNITFICNDDEEFKKTLPSYIKYIPVSMSRGISIKDIRAIFDMVKIFKNEKFDYIQYSTPNASFFASIASRFAKAPVRVYAQWGIRYVGDAGIKRVLLKFFEKIACLLSSHIRSVSKKNMEFAISEGLYKANKVKVIGNGGTIGVDMNNFDISKKDGYRQELHKKYNINTDEFVFGFVGRMNKDKGSEELLLAFSNLVNKSYKTKLFIVGNLEYTQDIDTKLIEWATESKHVIFTGQIDNKELDKYYALFDCYVHPTYREGFGMVLQEAGAMGNAIITTDIPGASEVMEDGVSCMLVQSKNATMLEEKMEYMINNVDFASKIGLNAYERTKTLYERSIMIENIEKDLCEILGE